MCGYCGREPRVEEAGTDVRVTWEQAAKVPTIYATFAEYTSSLRYVDRVSLEVHFCSQACEALWRLENG